MNWTKICESCNHHFDLGHDYSGIPIDSFQLIASCGIMDIVTRPQIGFSVKRFILEGKSAFSFLIRQICIGNRVLYPYNIGDTPGSLFLRSRADLAPSWNVMVQPGMDVRVTVINSSERPERFIGTFLGKAMS